MLGWDDAWARAQGGEHMVAMRARGAGGGEVDWHLARAAGAMARWRDGAMALAHGSRICWRFRTRREGRRLSRVMWHAWRANALCNVLTKLDDK